jgi:hypothetical protein
MYDWMKGAIDRILFCLRLIIWSNDLKRCYGIVLVKEWPTCSQSDLRPIGRIHNETYSESPTVHITAGKMTEAVLKPPV